MDKPIVIQGKKYIYFYRSLKHEDNDYISNFLKRNCIQIEYADQIEIYKFDEYSIISLVLSGQCKVNRFIEFLEKYSVNEIPFEIKNKIECVNKNLKKAKVELGVTEVIFKIISGDFTFLNQKKKLRDKLQYSKVINNYTFKRKDGYTIINELSKENVNIEFPTCSLNECINFILKKNIQLRYYQRQAYEAISSEKKGLVVMPTGSGKSYVILKLIGKIKKRTLILCEGKDNCYRWEKLIKEFSNNNDLIGIITGENMVISDITICAYDCIRRNKDVFNIIKQIDWGLIIYDNAHKVVTPKDIDALYLKAEHKYAFDSTIKRSDNKEIALINYFGAMIYNITSRELVKKHYLKELQCYKVDLRNTVISKYEFLKELIKKEDQKSILVVGFTLRELKEISKKLSSEILINTTKDREKIVEAFNKGENKVLCVGSLIEKYQITNVDIMVLIGYRGGTVIEEHFRIGRLMSTENNLENKTTVMVYYLINNDTEYARVIRKEKDLNKLSIELNVWGEGEELANGGMFGGL